LDLLVLVDIYRNDTAKFADIVLPAATFLEKTDIQAPDVAIPRVIQLQEKVVEPTNESWSEFKIIQELAKKMGYGEYFRETEEELIDRVLNHWGLSVDVLRQNRSGMVFEPNVVGYYHRNGFPTESGKIEIFSEKLKTLGFDPLPEFKEPTESPLSNRALAREFPLVLVTGNRVRSSYLSFLHNLPSLHRRNPENWVEIHPATAGARGIKDAEFVTVESPRGKIELKAKLNSKVDPRVVFIPYGWGHNYDGSWQLANSSPGESVNILTDHALTDAMSGMPNYKSLLCQVRK